MMSTHAAPLPGTAACALLLYGLVWGESKRCLALRPARQFFLPARRLHAAIPLTLATAIQDLLAVCGLRREFDIKQVRTLTGFRHDSLLGRAPAHCRDRSGNRSGAGGGAPAPERAPRAAVDASWEWGSIPVPSDRYAAHCGAPAARPVGAG